MLTLFSFLLVLPAHGYGASLDTGIRCAQELTSASSPSSQETDSVLVRARGLFEEAQRAREANDQSAARAKASEAIETLLEAGSEGEVRQARLSLLEDLGSLAYQTGELGAAKRAWSRVLEVLSETLPGDHPELQKVRGDLAVTIQLLGDFQGARAMQEQVLDVCSRTLPDDHPDLQRARANLAITIRALGDLQGARALQEKVLEVRSRTLPEDHPDLQMARTNLATTIHQLGDLQLARALQEQALAVYSRTLPGDHPDLQRTRANLAATLRVLGDLHGSRALFEQVLEVRSRTLPDSHPEVQVARGNLAITLAELGDLHGARRLLEQVLEVFSQTMPDDHPDLYLVRLNLATTIQLLGDFERARAVQEEVLAVLSRTLPDDHPNLQGARGSLAATIFQLGDLQGARALEEKVLDVYSRTLPDDHPDLQIARASLAVTIRALGDPEGARALQEQVLAVRSRTLPDYHHDLQAARTNLAFTIKELGNLQGARALEEQVLEIYSRTLPDDHPDLQCARENLAITTARLAGVSPAPSGGDGERERAGARCSELLLARCRAQTNAAREALLESSSREARARCETLARGLDLVLSFTAGYGVLDPLRELDRPSLVLSETTRAASLGSAALMRRAAGAPAYAELRESLREQSDELADLAQKGTTSEEFQAALARRDATERELVVLALELSGGIPAGLEFDPDALAIQLTPGDAIVALRRYARSCVRAEKEESFESLCALILRRNDARESEELASTLTRVELGPVEPIEAAVKAWREAIGVGVERGIPLVAAGGNAVHSRGSELRRLIFDPLLPALGDATRVVLALDDVLHLVPIDSLPSEEEPDGRFELVGDLWHIETRCTLAELLAPLPRPSSAVALVALGGAAFNSEPTAPSSEELAAIEDAEAESLQVASILRGGTWERGFAPLTYTGLEAREIASLFGEVFGEDRGAIVLEKRKASRAALEELAPRARWLHVATHGWFASESIRSWQDPEPLDRHSGLGTRLSAEEQVKGMSPMLLCGLALAGANLPENAIGRAPGLITAEELSALDLSGCELVVLSACDTNVGERRAGQGVASLQMALQMAGARSVITSLWKVPDEATRELMLDFYRRLWVEKKPKHQALWEAKMQLRSARDERGEPLYSTRDWASWVLTGEPD